MQPRFTLIQGGLSGITQQVVPMAERAGSAPAANAEAGRSPAPAGWRVELRGPAALREAEIEEWRALAARTTGLDPFADPDFLATSALHLAREQAGRVAFALAFCTAETGIERLCGVIPLALPNPDGRDRTVVLWQAPLAPRPVEPVFAEDVAADAVAALLDRLADEIPRANLRLTGLAAAGALLADLRADARFRVSDRRTPPSIPETQFVGLGARETVTRVERITASHRISNAVERLLLADARRARQPLLPDPAAASTVRVVSRLFARRGLIEVELHAARGELVSAAIRLGREGERVLWHSVNLAEAQQLRPRTADVEIALAGAVERKTPLRLVVS